MLEPPGVLKSVDRDVGQRYVIGVHTIDAHEAQRGALDRNCASSENEAIHIVGDLGRRGSRLGDVIGIQA